jgi:hypothetical protein
MNQGPESVVVRGQLIRCAKKGRGRWLRTRQNIPVAGRGQRFSSAADRRRWTEISRRAPPATPPERSRGDGTMLTVRARPSISLPFMASMAFCDSSGEPMVTNPKPRGATALAIDHRLA